MLGCFVAATTERNAFFTIRHVRSSIGKLLIMHARGFGFPRARRLALPVRKQGAAAPCTLLVFRLADAP